MYNIDLTEKETMILNFQLNKIISDAKEALEKGLIMEETVENLKSIRTKLLNSINSKVRLHYYGLYFYHDEDDSKATEKRCSYCIKTEIPGIREDVALSILFGKKPSEHDKEVMKNLTAIYELEEHTAVSEYKMDEYTEKVEDEFGIYYQSKTIDAPLPFSKGDTVWFVGKEYINNYKIRNLIFGKNGLALVQVSKEVCGQTLWNSFAWDNFGKIVFLNKKEAKKMLVKNKLQQMFAAKKDELPVDISALDYDFFEKRAKIYVEKFTNKETLEQHFEYILSELFEGYERKKVLSKEDIAKQISKKMVQDGLMSKVIVPKLEEDGLKAYIGESWFYFGGNYPNGVKWDKDPKDADLFLLAEEIYIVLEDLKIESEDEYKYYSKYLCENI